MPRPIFDIEQYELRGLLPKVFNKDQQKKLNESIARAQGQIDWSAQLLGFNGPYYWGRPTLRSDGTYDWKGLPETMNQKRQMQSGAFGVYNKDKSYQQWPAPFNRSEILTSGDAKIHVWELDGKTKLSPDGQKEICDYEHSPIIWAGGMYEFDAVVEFYNPVNIRELIKTEKFTRNDKFWTRMWVLTDAIDMIGVKVEGSDAEYAYLKVDDWEDISDWHHPEVKRQFIGLWGNKGNQLSLDFAFDALELHGFDERCSLSTADDSFKTITVEQLLASVGMVPTEWTGYYWGKFVFKVDGDSLYAPVPPATIDNNNYAFGLHEACNYSLRLLQSGDRYTIKEFTFESTLETDCPIENPHIEWFFSPELDNGTYDSPWIDLYTCYRLEGGDLDISGVPDYASCDYDENLPICCYAIDDEYNPNLPWIHRYENTYDNESYDYDNPAANVYDPNYGPWATVTEGEYDRWVEPIQASQQGSTSIYVNDEWASYDDGEFDEYYKPNCDADRDHYCGEVDGGDMTRLVFQPNYDDLDCEPGICAEINNEPYEEGDVYLGPNIVDGLTKEDPCGINDGGLYGTAHWEINPSEEEYVQCGKDGEGYGKRYYCDINNGIYNGVGDTGRWYSYDGCEIVWPDDCIPPDQAVKNPEYFDGRFYQSPSSWPDGTDPECEPYYCELDGSADYELGNWKSEDSGVDSGHLYTPYGIPDGGVRGNAAWENESYDTCYTPGHYACSVDGQPPFDEAAVDGGDPATTLSPCYYDGADWYENHEYNLDSIDPACYPYYCTLIQEKDNTENVDPGVYVPNVSQQPEPCPIDDWTPGKPEHYWYEPGRDWGWDDYEAGNCPPDAMYVTNCENDLQDCDDVGPCPIDDVHVKVRFIDAALFKINPSIKNSATPLRLWKDNVMTVNDKSIDKTNLDFRNFLVADENRGPNPHDNYRSYVRLPLEYARGDKEWNKAVQACNNQQYLQNPQRLSKPEYLESATPQIPLYDEAYVDQFDQDQVFYHEDFLVSSFTEDTTDLQDTYVDAEIIFESEEFSPFAFFTMSEYEPYDGRKTKTREGDWQGFYVVYGANNYKPTGHISTDLDNHVFETVSEIEQPIYDESYVKRPNVDFPEEIDSAELKNYVLGYAYFAADFSAADEPVFDPTQDYCWRHNNTICLAGDYPTCTDLETRVQTGYLLHAQFTNETYGRTSDGVSTGALETEEEETPSTGGGTISVPDGGTTYTVPGGVY